MSNRSMPGVMAVVVVCKLYGLCMGVDVEFSQHTFQDTLTASPELYNRMFGSIKEYDNYEVGQEQVERW